MGFFKGAKKEYYINRLVKSFKLYYHCGDMAAIECLRKNYSVQELKWIFQDLKKALKKNKKILNCFNPLIVK